MDHDQSWRGSKAVVLKLVWPPQHFKYFKKYRGSPCKTKNCGKFYKFAYNFKNSMDLVARLAMILQNVKILPFLVLALFFIY